MKIALFEDEKYDQLYPLSYCRPVFCLKCGHTLLWEKVQRTYKGTPLAFLCREYLAPVTRQKLSENIPINDYADLRKDGLLLINGRWMFLDGTYPSLEGPEEIGMCDDTIVYMRLTKNTVEEHFVSGYHKAITGLFGILPRKEVPAMMIDFPWDLIHHNPDAIVADFKAEGAQGIEGKFHPSSVVYGPEDQVYIAKGAEIQPHVVIDTTGGPVIIDEGAKVFPFTRIEGPSSVGKGSHIVGAKVREGTAIGPVCKVGGEIEESIIHAYSNKYHDGFFGHGYACEWVNFGALATNSDLKNNYGNVKVYNRGRLMDTKSNKVGSFIGDHTKMGIGLLLNTGTVIGICCNVFTSVANMPLKLVKSFSWGSGDSLADYDLEKVISNEKIVMGRRKIEQTPEYEEMLRNLKKITEWEKGF